MYREAKPSVFSAQHSNKSVCIAEYIIYYSYYVKINSRKGVINWKKRYKGLFK